MQAPDKVAVYEEPEGPVFVYRWMDWGFIIIFLFGLVFGLFPLWLTFKSLEYWFVVLFLLLFSLVGLGLSYWSLGRMINRTEIRLQHGLLSVRHKPLPWRYQVDLPVGDIQAISQETYYNRSRSSSTEGGFGIGFEGSFRNERLAAFVRTGKQSDKAIILIPKMELAAARFLEQEIETRLGLRQAQSAVEQEMAVQFSKQEQERIEAGQARMLIPVLMLGSALMLIIGVWQLISTTLAQREARLSLSWPSTVGQASGYTVYKHEPDSDDNWDTYYDATVEYTYIVNSKSYTIDQQIPGKFDTEREAAQNVESKYPPGAPLTLYYNPQKPARALVDRSGPGTVAFVMIGILFGVGLLGLFGLLFVARAICHAEGCPDDWKHWPFWREQVPFLGQLRFGTRS